MFCEKVFDVNSKMFQFMEENELIDQDEREIFKTFSMEFELEKKKHEKKSKSKIFDEIITCFQEKINSNLFLGLLQFYHIFQSFKGQTL